ncbi:MAG: hypothetical protein BroJett024_10260 [Alphaproteobacteria bacterium]|nr:MAG: hypothetical protein BroJett024_10260 [Alphaproteobacteria bacterium]
MRPQSVPFVSARRVPACGLTVALLATLALGGCAPRRAVVAYAPAAPMAQGGVYGGPYGGPYLPAPYAPVAFEQPYTLDSGDRLRIAVFGQEGLTGVSQIDASGQVTLALIGPVRARGLTTQQLADAIAMRLRQGYVREPHVAVEIEAYRPFFILGEVNAPGQYPYQPNMTAETAVAIAGGYSPRADKRSVQLTRNAYGQPARARVAPATPLRPGDTIHIPERWF